MTQKLFVWYSLSIICLWVLQLLILVQPYIIHDLNVENDTCNLPCFLGIHPTITTGDQAYTLLSAHRWVNDVNVETRSAVGGQISWGWSGQQPNWLDPGRRGRLWFSAQAVSRFTIYTFVPLGDIWLSMGQPQKRGVSWRSASGMDYNAGYDSEGVIISLKLNCPLRIPQFWNSTVQLTFGGDTSMFVPFDLSDWLQEPLCQ